MIIEEGYICESKETRHLIPDEIQGELKRLMKKINCSSIRLEVVE